MFNFAAFNKLLLLGLLAPVEEALAPEGTSQLVVQQLQAAAGTRQVCVPARMHACRQAHAFSLSVCLLGFGRAPLAAPLAAPIAWPRNFSVEHV